ncbi:MAG: aminopeptidase [Solirubrobacterales bacterium]|nr:aminopeptidase [Solirubrobacterales bacterium]
MSAPDPAAFADLLVGYCLEVKPNQQVLVRSTSLAAPLLLELQRAILAADAWPHLRVEVPGQTRGFYEHAKDWQLEEFPSLALLEARKVDAVLGIQAPEDVRAFAGIDPDRLTRARRARRPIQEQTQRKRWCSTIWPTPALADQAGLPFEEYAGFVTSALFLDRPAGPVTAWRELGAFQQQLAKRLGKARTVRIEADGTDVTLTVTGRTWVNSDGKRNMPSGEVFTGPLETSANGRVRYTIPSSPAGVEVRGVELEWADGEVVSATAEEGQAYLDQALATDAGARRLGELGIGTNYGIDRPTGTILLDEKIGGTVHLALGRSYPETGGTNESALHWDMICDLRQGGRITVDGDVLQEDGRFV